MGAADLLRMIFFPGDATYSTVSDMPVDVSPRYVVDENIIPFRSVRKPELTPIRAVDVVLRTPLKSWAPVRGRARNIPELPGQMGTRLFPLGSDPDIKRTGFSGTVPTLNRTFSGLGNGLGAEVEPSFLPPGEEFPDTRIMNCVASASMPKTCYSCCETSFPRRPFKRHRCKKKCDTKFVGPQPGPSPVPGVSGFGYNPGYIYNDKYALVPAYTNPLTGRKNYSPGFGSAADCAPGQNYDPETGECFGIKRFTPEYFIVGPNQPSGGGQKKGSCGSWFQDPDTGCGMDMLKVGLIGAGILMVVMKS